MLLWILISITTSYGQIREAEYECGPHGRFEYCIDGIPGCVIGCHCHPGYYFDTDTKICEPNIKLTHNFRRNYDLFEPTRVHEPPVTSPVLEEPATTVTNAVDEKIDIITKDADDLGDWLYNQFFKTIENQVINETKDDGIVTRRSGSLNGPSFLKKPTRRSHKYWKARKKKKKKKKKGLRSKLLRITEDDSLFDSSSSSTSDESSDSSSSSDVSSDDSKEKKDKNDHGHKKMIVYNKRPKPPLPSFIFLPNMETPFFPPIGLPPPPIPMYPMIPVPPMMPFPYPGQATTSESTTPATDSSTAPTTPTAATATTAAAASAATSATPEENVPQEEVPDQNEKKNENEGVIDENEEVTEGAQSALRSHSKARGRPRHKLMQKLRQKLKRKNKLQNYFANEYQGPEPPLIEDDVPPDCIPNPVPNLHKPLPTLKIGEGISGLQDVDFKYLSQLIHRADLNKTNINPIPPKEITKNAVANPPPSRRNYFESNHNDIAQLLQNLANQPANHIIPNQPIYNVPQPFQNISQRKKIEDTNDTYYANLGRQIASMIRNIDGDKDIDIEIVKSNSMPSNSPVFNGNSYGSRSYWERSVRSPYKYMNSFKKEMNYLKKSNENLFSLENQVEIAASTEPVLTLQDLENIFRKMEKTKSKLVKKTMSHNRNHAESSKTSFNVNLLPGNDKLFHSNRIVKKEPQYIQTKYRPYYDNAKIKTQNSQSPIQPELKTALLTNFRRILPDTVKSLNETVPMKNIVPNINMLPTRKPKSIEAPHYIQSNYFKTYAYTVLPLPTQLPLWNNIKLPLVQATTSKAQYHQSSPMEINHKSLTYYTGNNNQYLFEKASIPVKYPTFSSNIGPFEHYEPYDRRLEPSYFHHELHHFDYFDDFS